MTRGPGAYAGIVSRGIAFAIDGTVALLVCTVGYQLMVALLATVGITGDELGGAGRSLSFVIALPVVFGVYCAGWWALIGRTPGMMLLGLRVVKADGSPPGVRRSIVRALGYWVSAIFLLGFAWIAVDRRSQGFHDKLARTFVVFDWPERATTPAPSPALGGGHP